MPEGITISKKFCWIILLSNIKLENAGVLQEIINKEEE